MGPDAVDGRNKAPPQEALPLSGTDYRSAELGIDPVPFTKTFIKPDGTGHRKNHLLSGVCRVTMKRSTDAFITTITWVDFVRESFQN